MALYKYIKKEPKVGLKKSYFSAVLSLTGFFLILWVAYPILKFELTSRIKFTEIISPVPETESVYAFEDKNSQVLGKDTSTEVDYTKASNWFPKKPQDTSNFSGRIYFISIPKLRIKDAVTKIAGEDLSKSLIHYGGTGLPGEYGNAVIFGHSTLPQLYNPENYKTIFSLLPELEEGDEIFVKFDGLTYRYVVINMWITEPNDISVLEQKYDSSYISLITCVPPGTYWKRLVVKARLEKF